MERGSIITAGLRRVAVTCRESVSSCAALAASGTITKILNGFKSVFTNNDPRYQGTFTFIWKVSLILYLLDISVCSCHLINCFRFATCSVGSFYVIGDAIDLARGVGYVSVFL